MFKRQHAPNPVCLYAGAYRVWVAGTWSGDGPCVAKKFDGIEFLGVAGTLFYRRSWQKVAAKCLLEDLVAGEVDETMLFGAFAVAYWDGVRLRLFTDWLGGLCVYRNSTNSVWSTSFLATADSSKRRTLNLQGAYEYLFQESTFGADTICNEVERVAPDRSHDIGRGLSEPRADPIGRVEEASCSLGDHVDRVVAALDPVFDSIVGSAGNRIDTAISGGYDSRLILALLRARGVRPRLHVYGSDADSDVRIARQICAGEGLTLEHIDKSRLKLPAADSAGRDEQLERNYLRFDGYPIDGIFDSGADLATRIARMSDGHLLLNGGGGEIFRNFYYLSNRPYKLRELLHAFYSRFDPADCSDAFVEDEYYERLERKLAHQLGCSTDRMTRLDVERTYPLFRCRFWMARNTSINCRLGYAMTPLVEPAIVRAALSTPLRLKNLGTFEAALIRRIDPKLASYPSAYGRAFDREPSAKARLAFALTLLRPPRLRRYVFRVKNRLKRFKTTHASGTLNESLFLSTGLLRPTANDESQGARLATLGFTIERLSIEL